MVLLTSGAVHSVVGHVTRSVAMHEVRKGGYSFTNLLGIHGFFAFLIVAIIAAIAWTFIKKMGSRRK